MKAARIKAVIFDLDDTLYEERQYFRSGFAVVAQTLEQRGFGSGGRIALLLDNFHHAEGRQEVFQKLAVRLGFPENWVPELVELFRSHQPAIELAAEVRELLVRLRDVYQLRLGCVTDGWLAVQRRKVDALNVEPLLDVLVIADELGRNFWKPHPHPFHTCCTRLGVEPEEAVFVGDNPERDILGARRAGLATVRLRRPGAYFEAMETVNAEARPDFEISRLTELERLFGRLGLSASV